MATTYQRAAWAALRSGPFHPIFRGMGLEAGRGPALPPAPFLLLSDHSNSLDPLAIGLRSPSPIRFMANIEGVSPLMAAFADLVGAYGRRKGRNDMAAYRRTLDLAARGEAIGIFPEGDRSWDGATQPFRPGVGRLARKLGLPLVLVRQKGNYLARPRWAKCRRSGPWSLEVKVFGADEVGRLSAALLESLVERALSKDDVKDAEREGRAYAGSGTAEGVERLLWRCPVCGHSDDAEGRGTSLRGAGDEIRCERCGSRWSLDANLRLEPVNIPSSSLLAPIGDLKDWSDWQLRTLPELIGSPGAGLGRPGEARGFRASRVAISRMSGGRRVRLGLGALRLSDGELLFEGGGSRLVFRAAEVRGFVDNFNAYSEFGYRGESWRLEFAGGNIAKWCYAFGLPPREGRGGQSRPEAAVSAEGAKEATA